MGRRAMGTGMANGNGDGNGNGTPPAPDPYVDEVKSLNPIAYWRLSDPLGSAEAKDEIGQPALLSGNNPGAVQGTVLFDQAPLNLSDPNATSAHFDGTGFVEVAHDARLRDGCSSPSRRSWHPDSVVARAVVVGNMSSSLIVGGGWALAHRPAFRRRRPGHRWALRARDKRWLRSGRWSSPGGVRPRKARHRLAPGDHVRRHGLHVLLGWSEGRLGHLAVRLRTRKTPFRSASTSKGRSRRSPCMARH